MKNFYLTFGQQYPWRNGWVLVQAEDYARARAIVVEVFESKWSNLYEEEKFDRSFFPAGQIGETMV